MDNSDPRKLPSPPPVNVRLRYGSEVVPVSCMYVGMHPSGTRVWEVIDPRPGEIPTVLEADQLPPHTVVRLVWPRAEDDGLAIP